jgi:hypothetical protein
MCLTVTPGLRRALGRHALSIALLQHIRSHEGVDRLA